MILYMVYLLTMDIPQSRFFNPSINGNEDNKLQPLHISFFKLPPVKVGIFINNEQ